MTPNVSEAAFTKKVKSFLDNLPLTWYYKVFGGGMQKAGIPDIIACVNGHFVALELKSDIGRASELQKRNVRLINKSNGIAMIVHPNQFQDLKETLRNLLVVSVNER
jgi:hypothetical protein